MFFFPYLTLKTSPYVEGISFVSYVVLYNLYFNLETTNPVTGAQIKPSP